jgi:hypothetical protein
MVEKLYGPLSREAIEQKRRAEALGQIDVPTKLEKRIVALGKIRTKP